MIRIASFLLLVYFTSAALISAAQDIPIGQWRAHLSFNQIKDIEFSTDFVYAASQNGVLIVDRADNSLSVLSKLNGLTGSDITDIAYDENTSQLLIAYADGAFDLSDGSTVRSFTRLRDENFPGSKRINGVLVHQANAYLATDFGIVVIDLSRREIKETWRDLGVNGSTLRIHEAIIQQKMIIAATEKGVMMGDLSKNLLDYNQWTRFSAGDLDNDISHVALLNNVILCAVKGRGLFRFDGTSFVQENYLQGQNFLAVEPGIGSLLVTTGNGAFEVINGLAQSTNPPGVSTPLVVKENNGTRWFGDERSGLISNATGAFQSYLPNAPGFNDTYRLRIVNGNLYAVRGGFNANGTPTGKTGEVSIFSEGLWSVVTYPIQDITDVALHEGKLYLSSFGNGLLEVEGSTNTLYTQQNSTLSATQNSTSIWVSAIKSVGEQLWCVNYGATPALHSFSQQSGWNEYLAFTTFATDIAVGSNGELWFPLNPTQSSGVAFYNPTTSETQLRTETQGAGGLPSRVVRSVAADREGLIWVGTDAGVVYFSSTSGDAIRPIFENRFLLRDERITAIAVDGGNRKWIGTERGVWLFNPAGEVLIYNFTAENSPLLSNRIIDIEINDATGEVFLATDKGLISFRADATTGEAASVVKIFPNPITSEFSGTVGITGLATDAAVRITDVAGRLVWQTQANGTTATWNVVDREGKRARTGVYLVFALSPDGKDSMVGKIAVIE